MGTKALQRNTQVVLKKIFLTGGSGTLGSELIKISKAHEVEFIAPASKYCDITNPYQIHNHIKDSGCDTIVHSAAITDVKATENDPSRAWEVNVLGTLNVLKSCKYLGKKLVFISTDYVFDGEKGNYTIDDPINPLSKYAKTKAAAELLVIAPKIMARILNHLTGIVHVGNNRRTIYDIASDRAKFLQKEYRMAIGKFIPKDVSLV